MPLTMNRRSPGFTQPEPPGLADELVAGAGARDATLQARALGLERPDVGLAALELMLRVEVRVCRLPVEERHQDEAADRE